MGGGEGQGKDIKKIVGKDGLFFEKTLQIFLNSNCKELESVQVKQMFSLLQSKTKEVRIN